MSAVEGGTESQDCATRFPFLTEAVQQRLDANPRAMRQRRETVEHPFDTMKARMEATHTSSPYLEFLIQRLLGGTRIDLPQVYLFPLSCLIECALLQRQAVLMVTGT